MTTTTTHTSAQVNGEATYSYKFIPKVTAIPVVNSLTKHILAHVPQAEAASKYFGDHLNTAFNYTKDTPIQPILIKLDTLAANGVAKLEREVPIVNTPTEEVIKKTQIDKLLGFFTHYYAISVDFIFNFLGAYKGVLDPTINIFLGRFEGFLGISTSPEDTQAARIQRIRKVIVEKVDLRVTPFLSNAKESYSSVYAKAQPLIEYPLNQTRVQKAKAMEIVRPYVSTFNARYAKAETAAKEAWTETKPNLTSTASIIPAFKSIAFVVISFAHHLLHPEKPSAKAKKIEEQTNGLVSGVELRDGEAKKRPNGKAN